MSGERRFRVSEGTVLVYRLFDLADEIDLGAAETALATSAERSRLEAAQSVTSLQLPRPPLQIRLGVREMPLRDGARRAEATAAAFDYGVVSIRYALRIEPGTSLQELIPLGEELAVDPTPELDGAARREADEVARALGPALERPHTWEGFESYQVFFVRGFEDATSRAADLLAEAPLAELVLGETSPVPLSAAERQEVLAHHHTYLEDDLAVVHWNCAFAWEPSGVEDIPDLLEFATAHLLELRYYDALLDRELRRVYDELGRRVSPVVNVLAPRYRSLQRRIAALLLELSEMIERLENAVKIVGDFYFARVYQGAVRRFRLPAWQETVLRKQRLLAEVNDLMGDAADTRRSEILEIAVILLIVLEIVAAFR